MESNESQNDNVRKIEDIIEIQRAKGNFSVRQVVFNLPPDSNAVASTNLTQSLESGLSKEKIKVTNKMVKKFRSKLSKSPLPDALSWPSDSDITVLRMKLGLSDKEMKDKVGAVVPGDGLHQPDSSSMINLATLILQSQSPSKHSMNVDEYLLPLTTWGHCEYTEEKQPNEDRTFKILSVANDEPMDSSKPSCHRERREAYIMSSRDSDYSKNTKRSKMARFLRLYFCPCCTCLYRLEKMQDDPSSYFTNHNEINVY